MAGLKRTIAESDSTLIELAVALSESMEVVDGATEYSLASGHAGYSLMFTHLARYLTYHGSRTSGVEKSFEMAERHLKAAAAAWEATALRPVGLFEGVSGYVFALGAFEEARFGAAAIATRMSSKLAWSLDKMPTYANESERFAQHDFDIVSGVAGAIAVCNLFGSAAELSSLKERLWRKLSVDPRNPELSFVFQWEQMPSEALSRAHPDGYIDLGLAHGLAGMWSRVAPDGSEPVGATCGLLSAIESTMEWICQRIIAGYGDGAWHIRASAEGFKQLGAQDLLWCYGRLPAAVAIGGLNGFSGCSVSGEEFLPHLSRLIVEADFDELLSKITTSDSYGICHGLSGALSIIHSLWRNPLFREELDRPLSGGWEALESAIISGWNFHDLGREDCRYSGFLNGVTGALVAYLASSLPTNHRNWKDIRFLLMGDSS